MSGWRPVVKIIAEYLSQHQEKKHVVPAPFCRIRVGKDWTFFRKFVRVIKIYLSRFNPVEIADAPHMFL
jgi:hypothetical protein